MKINQQLTDNAVLTELGRRLARSRVEIGITQAQAAEQAGVGKRTIERIEAGDDTQLTTFIRLLRTLGMVDNMEQLVPETTVSPIEMLKLKGKQRRRASSKKMTKSGIPWHWGDEQ